MLAFSIIITFFVLKINCDMFNDTDVQVEALLGNSTVEEVLEERKNYTSFIMQESFTMAKTDAAGTKTCFTYYRRLSTDDYTDAGVCTMGNCKEDSDFVDCKTYFPEKFANDDPDYK